MLDRGHWNSQHESHKCHYQVTAIPTLSIITSIHGKDKLEEGQIASL